VGDDMGSVPSTRRPVLSGRAPAQAFASTVVGASADSQKNEDYPALSTLEKVDERGYVSTRKLHMGGEAGVCRTPFGARIVAGKHSLKEPQYAWDYASVQMAVKALVYAEFNTHPRKGIIRLEDIGRGCSPAAEPKDYLRRWRYIPEGQMERF
jgi:hypothetical protein